MQQDIIMEKKSATRTNQPTGKGQGTDSKKNQDAPNNNKPWTRGTRSTHGTNPKPPPFRNKNVGYDKRPRPRSGGQMGGKTYARLEDEWAEPGSVINYGAKKQSLNHLLNFHYTPRTSNAPGAYGRQYFQKLRVNYPKYNKEHYLQANCQFIVREGEDYSVCLNNPDALVDWAYIEQILIKSVEQPTCPICLEKPLAGRITRCGHIYCYPCLLHYLALSDKTWRKCPICYEAVHLQDLRSVCWVPIGSFGIGDMMTLQLMRRPRRSMQSWPIDFDHAIKDANISLPNLNDGPYVVHHCKLLQANSKQVLNIIGADLMELNATWQLEKNTPEACFIQQAIELLKDYEMVKLKNMPPMENTISHMKHEFEHIAISDYETNLKDLESDVADFMKGGENPSLSETLETPGCSGSSGDILDKDFYFYQASDGQHIYLAGLCTRILEHSYGGSLALCPKTITATVEAREVLTVTEDLRKRLRYLQHLPVTCQIEFVHLNLIPPIVKIESLNLYHDQLEARRKSRIRKNHEENLRDLKITREQERKQKGFPLSESCPIPQRAVRIDSESDFPLCGSPPYVDPPSDSDVQAANILYESNNAGPSFATMVTMPRSPLQSNFVKPIKKYEPLASVRQSETVENVNQDESYIPAPSYTQSFHDAISQAMEKSCQLNVSSKDGNSKKNKKKKKQILFATGMNIQM